MRDIERLLIGHGGVVSTAQLIDAGMNRRTIRVLEAKGWRSLRFGWWACPGADPAVESAVKLGGVLACESVLRRSHVWTPSNNQHIRFGKHSHRSSGIRNCRPRGHNPPLATSVDSLETALSSAVNCLDVEEVIVVLDSMLHLKLIDEASAATALNSSRFAHLDLLSKCDRKSESGTETMVRVRLRGLGIHVRTQVVINTIGRVDLLIGKRLIIEYDGLEYHAGQFEADRERDRRLIALGFIVIRLSYNQVVYDWTAALPDILAVIRRREHRRAAQIVV
ncbi:DUF559 domain-containing protein [Smaragdicoccus niigatensis]|uniref:DUF559 domain-containing protein n=1 Tax=Smaragdicoccus niigatensis TaxID=359359 RepID=UPI00036593B2|nr:DUF559 domain-containing protein [Smaragdicoccus niigatensis]